MSSRGSRTITAEQVRARCRTIVLKLKSPSNGAAETEPRRVLNDLQKRVDDRFNILMGRFVIDKKGEINAELLAKLRKTEDPDTCLEAVITHIYGKAVKEEEDAVSPGVPDEEQREVNTLVDEVSAKHRKN